MLKISASGGITFCQELLSSQEVDSGRLSSAAQGPDQRSRPSCFLLSFNVLPHGPKMKVAFPKVRKLYDSNQHLQSVFSHNICLSKSA